MTVQEIAIILEGEILGDPGQAILRVAKIEDATSGDLTFLANPKYEKFVAETKASAILVSKTFDVQRSKGRNGLTFVRVSDPYVGFLQIMKRLTPMPDPFPGGVHATAIVGESSTLGTNVALGAHAVVGRNVAIGSKTKIAAGCVIGDDVVIGERCLFYPNVTIYHGCRIGNGATFQSGSVIGSDGFGFAPKSDGTYEKIPQMGIVVIEDDVEIGANCTIDRATIGQTLIRKGVKVDNLVHIAHNVVVGENTVIAAQTGISGSTKIGRNVIIAGQVGIVGHIEIADKTVLLAKAGVAKSTEAGKTYFGSPAKEHMHALKIEAVIRSLPELAKTIEELRKSLEKMSRHKEEPTT